MRVCAALIGLLLGGCIAAEPAAVIGSGELEWESLGDGDELAVIFGSQGGYHLLGSVRVAQVEAGDAGDLENPDNPTTRFDVVHDGDSILRTGEFTQGMERTPLGTEGGWTHEVVGRRAVVDIQDDDELDGETVLFSVEVTDVNGLVVSQEIEVEIFPHPLN